MDLGVPFVWGLGEGPTDLQLEPPQATFISGTPRVWSPTLLRAGGCLWRPTASYAGRPTLLFQSGSDFWDQGSKSGRRPSAVVPPPSAARAVTGTTHGPASPRPPSQILQGPLPEDTQLGSPGLGRGPWCLALTLHPVGVTRSHHES